MAFLGDLGKFIEHNVKEVIDLPKDVVEKPIEWVDDVGDSLGKFMDRNKRTLGSIVAIGTGAYTGNPMLVDAGLKMKFTGGSIQSGIPQQEGVYSYPLPNISTGKNDYKLYRKDTKTKTEERVNSFNIGQNQLLMLGVAGIVGTMLLVLIMKK